MSVIHIPATADAAVAELGSLGRLINARKWERAAIVAALVGPPTGSGGRSDRKQNPISGFAFSLSRLAEQGITGLRKTDTIAHYRDVWCKQRPVPTLGEAVDLTDLPEWPGVPEEELAQHTGMTPERRRTLLEAGQAAGMPTGAKVVDVAANAKAMEAAILADEATAAAAEAALGQRYAQGHTKPDRPTPFGRRMLDANEATTTIHMRVMQAAILLRESQDDWHTNYINLSERERREVDMGLVEVIALAGTLQMYSTLDNQQ